MPVNRARPRRRRLVALVVALAAVGIAVGVDGAPAGAFCPSPPNGCGSGPPPAPPPAPDVPPAPFPQPNPGGPWIPPPDQAHPPNTTGDPGAGKSEKAKKAADLAKKAVAREPCNKAISGGNTAHPNNAKDNWSKNTITEMKDSKFTDEKGEEKPDVAASVPGTSNGYGYGEITTWGVFYNDTELETKFKDSAQRVSTALYNIVRPWSADQIRAFLLLHEFAHLQGSLPGDHKGDWKPNNQWGFHLRIAQNCKFS